MANGKQVSFRLSAPYDAKLAQAAKKAKSGGEHAYARLVLVRHLENAESMDLKEDMAALKGELVLLRAEVSTLADELKDFRAEFKKALN